MEVVSFGGSGSVLAATKPRLLAGFDLRTALAEGTLRGEKIVLAAAVGGVDAGLHGQGLATLLESCQILLGYAVLKKEGKFRLVLCIYTF